MITNYISIVHISLSWNINNNWVNEKDNSTIVTLLQYINAIYDNVYTTDHLLDYHDFSILHVDS